MYRRTRDRDHQRGSGLPPVFLARRTGSRWRVVSGLSGLQSQALPYVIPGVVRMLERASCSFCHLSDPVLPTIWFSFVILTHAVNETGRMICATLLPLSPTNC